MWVIIRPSTTSTSCFNWDLRDGSSNEGNKRYVKSDGSILEEMTKQRLLFKKENKTTIKDIIKIISIDTAL